MRAAVVTAFDRPLIVEDRPVPEPGAGEIVVRIETSGLCQTDIHASRGDWSVQPQLPFVPGHEGVGIVESLGPGVATPRIGQRVALTWLGWACGECELCIQGWDTLCPAQQNTGYRRDGTYAEFAVASAKFVVAVPDGVDPLDAAALSCAGVTAYKAVQVARVGGSDVVAVFGVGELGYLAVQYARIAGCTVVAIDVRDDRLDMARVLGATSTINAAVDDPGDVLAGLGGAHAAIVTALSPKPFEHAVAGVRRGGRIVTVGLPGENAIALPTFQTVVDGVTVTGAVVGTRLDLAEVFDLHAAGRTSVERVTRRLDEINRTMKAVDVGDIAAKVVFDLRKRPTP